MIPKIYKYIYTVKHARKDYLWNFKTTPIQTHFNILIPFCHFSTVFVPSGWTTRLKRQHLSLNIFPLRFNTTFVTQGKTAHSCNNKLCLSLPVGNLSSKFYCLKICKMKKDYSLRKTAFVIGSCGLSLQVLHYCTYM